MAWANDGAALTAPLPPHYPLNLPCILPPLSGRLRDNKPDKRNGYSSLHLLSPSTDKIPIHLRKASNATFASSAAGHSGLDETEPNHSDYGIVPLHPIKSPSSTVVSPTHTLVDSASALSRSQAAKSYTGFSDDNVARSSPVPDIGAGGSSESRKSDQENGPIPEVELVQDELVNRGPFKFRPFELASLLDPKNLEALEALGGVDDLLEALGTHRSRGLILNSTSPTFDGRSGAGIGASERHARHLPTFTIMAPRDDVQGDVVDGTSGPYLASLEERRCIFGENILPQRASKSLLTLMWLALKDKVFVRIF